MPKSKRKIISFNSKENNLLFQHRGEGLENIRAEEYRDFDNEVRDEKSFKSYIKKMKMSWAAAALTTVGYGDVYPVTALGKVFAVISAFSSIGIVALPAGILAGSFTEKFRKKK